MRGRGAERLGELVVLALGLVLAFWGAGITLPTRALDAGQRAPGTLRVVTWNVGQSLAEGASPLSEREEAHVADRLRALGPDLVVLEELAGYEQVDRLTAALGSGWSAVASSPGASRLVAILARGAPLERLRLPRVQGRAVAARWSADGHAVLVVGLHADAFSAEERNRLVGDLRTRLDGEADGAARLLVGDFNVDLDLDKRRDLFTDDAHLDVETYNVALAASDGAPELVDVGARGGPTAEPDRRLDYVLADSAAFRAVQAGPWLDQRAPGMDHDPVVADLAWR